MNADNRYIVLSDTIIDREKVVIIYRDADDHNKVWIELQGAEKQYFTGQDARELWREFDPETGWK